MNASIDNSRETDSMPSFIKGIKLTEVLITISLATIIVVVAVPTVGTLKDNSDANQIVGVAKSLSAAVVQYRKDVGSCAIEFSASADGNSYVHPRFHQLSMPQPIRGWNGPYMDAPLSRSQNPFGGSIYLQSDLGATPASGFSLNGIANKKSKGSGQFVVFHNVPRRVAEEVDKILDENSTNRRRWQDTGRVEFAPGGGGSLSICLLDNEDK